MAREKWKRELEAILREIPGYNPWDHAWDGWLDHHAAAEAINFFATRLRHVEGAARGQPFTLRRWQAAIVGNLFGWQRKDDADRVVRKYRKAYCEIPRGNGKTPLTAGIVLAAFFLDDEHGAQNYLAAGQRDQAGFLFRNARGMIEQDPELLAQVRIYGGNNPGAPRSITKLDDPLSFVKVIPADAAGQHGGIPHVTAVDELHAQQSRDLIDVFETAMAKRTRKQPMLVMITTADFDRPSICNEMADYARKVRDNGGNPDRPGYDHEFLPVIYSAGDDEDWHDDEVLARVNPNLGVSVSLKDIQQLRRKAEEQPALENAFRRLHLNQKTSQNVRIVPMESWRKCKDIPLTPGDLKGRRCFAGFDLASTEDLASFALLFPLEEERLAALFWSFCPEDKVASRAKQRIPYDVWERQGHLIATKGNQIDYDVIVQTFMDLRNEYDIVEAGFDPHQATHMQQRMMNECGEGFVVNVPQTLLNLSAPFKHILRAVKTLRLAHFGNPVAEWAASNVAGYYKGRIPVGQKLEDYLDKVPVIPSKQLSADKIDPITALVIACARMLAAGVDDGGSDGVPMILVM